MVMVAVEEPTGDIDHDGAELLLRSSSVDLSTDLEN
jgi:hypothetical protein